MSDPLRAEALGDWNNIKGTEYHLVYALWLLMREGVASVAFYQGNDLSATPILPPPHGREEQIIPVSVQDAGKDIWIQLKATQKRWTCSKVLSDSLVPTFVWNFLLSTRRQRQPEIRLVTQGQIARDEIEEFLANPEAKPRLNQKLEERVREAAQGWTNWLEAGGGEGEPLDQAAIRQLTLDIMRQIACTEPVPLSTLKAEIEAEIYLIYPDRGAGKAILDLIIGRMVQEAARGPEGARVLDANWLNKAAGCPLHPQGRFDRDPIEACTVANDRYLRHLEWTTEQYEPRQYVEELIDRFLSAGEPVFVLLGGEGSGKSWIAARQTAVRREGWVPLLIHGTELDRRRELDELIACQFRRDTQADISDSQLVQKLMAAVIGRDSHLLLVLDGVPAPNRTDRDIYGRDLKRLVETCCEQGVKLIITCDEGVWHHYQLGGAFKAEVFQEDASLVSARKPYSLALASLTVDELTGIAQRRLGTERGVQVAAWLEKPAFQPMRNPSLLAQYLREHVPVDWRPGQPLEAVTVDELIDERVKPLADVLAGALGYEKDDVQRALDDLVPSLWQSRGRGMLQREAVRVLDGHFPDLGNEGVRDLILEGLLTHDGGLRIADPAIFAHMVARWLGKRIRTGEAVEDELRLGQDDGVVTALVRGVLTDSLDWAERLIAHDRRWVRAVARGLAEGPSQDLRRLALLVGLTRAADGEGIDIEACQALGTLAARSRRARKWLAQMYLSDNRLEQARGERALGAALDFKPRWVGTCIRLRLAQPAVQEHREFGRPTAPDHALALLVRSKHMLATRVARRLLQRFVNLPIDEHDRESVRGVVAAVDPEVGNEWSESILSELRSGDPAARRRAAKAVLPIVQRKPEVAQNAVLAALQGEDTPEVVIPLLSAAYNLAELVPDELLDALRASCLLDWSHLAPWTGAVLALLAKLAAHRPSATKDLVPERLGAFQPQARAWLSEILSYVWWRVGEYDAAAQEVLKSLAKPELEGVPEEYRTFAVRGAATAQLALVCLDSAPGQHLSELLRVMFFYPDTQWQFWFLDISDLLDKQAGALTKHPDTRQLTQLLHQCVREEAEHEADILNRPLRSAQHHCARMCIEFLAYLASAGPDPLSTIEALPRDWQALAAVNHLLESGCFNEEVISFARANWDEHRHKGTANALAEGGRCLALLARLDREPMTALKETRNALPPGIWGASGRVETLEQLCSAHPGQMLTLLSQAVCEEEAIPILYEWAHRARSWRTALLSQTYARMFDTTFLTNTEAYSLCEQILTVLESLPQSPLREEYHAVYENLSKWLIGERLSVSAMGTEESLISQSHDHAFMILRRTLQDPDVTGRLNWIGQLLDRGAGWIETTSYQIKQGGVLEGSGLYAIYVLPAVRLALHAVGRQAGVADPAGKFMQERKEVRRAFDDQPWVLQGQVPPSILHQVRDSLGKRLQQTPFDERLWERLGYILLSIGELENAYKALRHCLELPTCGDPIKVTALYNLACVCAQMDQVEQCQTMLVETLTLAPEQREWARSDPDLEPVRGTLWFGELVGEE